MQVDGIERHLIDHCQLHHHHPRHPEKQDVRAGDEIRGGEKPLQHIILRIGLRLAGPAQSSDGPKTGGEPGVEHIGITGQLCAWASERLRLCLGRGAILRAALIKPNRNLMAPPQLPRNAPRLNIFKPMKINFLF